MSDKKIVEFRGVENLVYAKVLSDTKDAFETGDVKDLAGVAEISRNTNSSTATHFYDNKPAVNVNSQGADEVTINVSVIGSDVLAELTGQYYDETTGMYVEQEATPGYYAMGYKTKLTDGTEMYIWRLKGTFSIPDEDNKTEDDSTDANGQEIVYTGISTIHEFTKTGKSAKAVKLPADSDKVDTSTFFASVQTPDTIKEKDTTQGSGD